LPNTYVYVDGFNLYYGAVRGTPYKWLDIGALCRNMLPGKNILRIKYFTANVSARPWDAGAPARQQAYYRALKTIPNLTIHLGKFLTNSVPMVLTGSNPVQKVWVDKTSEKGSDVNLASHLLLDGFRGHYQLAVVISNDSDLAEPIRMVRHELGLRVGVLNPRHRHSNVLKPHATFVQRIRQSDLISAQFPPMLHDGKGPIHKPTPW